MVPVTQYSVIVVSSSSLVKRRSTSPAQSLQAVNFSAIQAARPAGESARAQAGGCGRGARQGAEAPPASPPPRPPAREAPPPPASRRAAGGGTTPPPRRR